MFGLAIQREVASFRFSVVSSLYKRVSVFKNLRFLHSNTLFEPGKQSGLQAEHKVEEKLLKDLGILVLTVKFDSNSFLTQNVLHDLNNSLFHIQRKLETEESIKGIVLLSSKTPQWSFGAGFDPEIMFLPCRNTLKNYLGIFMFILLRLLLIKVPKVLCLNEGKVDLSALLLAKCCDISILSDRKKNSEISFSLQNGNETLIKEPFLRGILGEAAVLSIEKNSVSTYSLSARESQELLLLDEILETTSAEPCLPCNKISGLDFNPLLLSCLHKCNTLISQGPSACDKPVRVINQGKKLDISRWSNMRKPIEAPWDLNSYICSLNESVVVPPRNPGFLRSSQFSDDLERLSKKISSPKTQEYWEVVNHRLFNSNLAQKWENYKNS